MSSGWRRSSWDNHWNQSQLWSSCDQNQCGDSPKGKKARLWWQRQWCHAKAAQTWRLHVRIPHGKSRRRWPTNLEQIATLFLTDSDHYDRTEVWGQKAPEKNHVHWLGQDTRIGWKRPPCHYTSRTYLHGLAKPRIKIPGPRVVHRSSYPQHPWIRFCWDDVETCSGQRHRPG